MPLPRTTAAVAALCAAAFVPLAVQAQTAEPKIATRDELRVCMNAEADLLKQREAIDARIQQNNAENAAIKSEADELAQEKTRVEQSTMPMARDRFERKVRQHNARVDASRAKSEAARAELETLKKNLDEHNHQCGGMAFRPEDKAAILKEREGK
jgi:chromosome segregation ATPase